MGKEAGLVGGAYAEGRGYASGAGSKGPAETKFTGQLAVSFSARGGAQ